jgi:AbiU2
MSKSLEEQKDFIIDAVLNLQHKADSLDYLIGKLKEKDTPKVKIAFAVFDNLLEFVYLLLWENIVVNLYWLYDKKGQRSLIWYLKQMKASNPSEEKVDEQIKRIELLGSEIEKVKKFRNKWIAHRDKEPFEDWEEFWKKEGKLTIQEVKTLTETAFEIIQEHFSIPNSKNSGIQIPFLLSEVFVEEDFIFNLERWGLLNHHNSIIDDSE